MATWLPYHAHHKQGEHTVTGDVRVLPAFRSPQLGNVRDLLVYLPPSYGWTDLRYPVIYMHDGQNLFDAATSYAGEWQVDETMEALSSDGLEAIIVGIPNMGKDRANEYLPYYDRRVKSGGCADRYIAFLTETVKPLIDAEFRTLPDRAHTGLLGSSFGGYISLWALLKRPEVFGFAGIFSPAFWPAKNAIFADVEPAAMTPARIYMDIGTGEAAGNWIDRVLLGWPSRQVTNTARRMEQILRAKGHELRYVEDQGARHNEAAWARRLPAALRFLLTDRT
ncbi:MAG TPA: alpha/beta hydrolase-fold protein [Symbiobacteriaceae bacterium]|nr:alpha/beta hydrolase-fold protein [Symbiobacteriaceae bacterium]